MIFFILPGAQRPGTAGTQDAESARRPNRILIMPTISERVLLHRVLGWCVSHTKELLVDWNLARQGKEPKWIDWTIDRRELVRQDKLG